MNARRRGVSLVELMVALMLGTLVVALCATTVVAQRRAEHTIGKDARNAAAADEAVRVLAAVLERVATADSVWLRGDTAIEVRATVGVAVACAASGDSLMVPDTGLAAWWETSPDSGDAVEITTPTGDVVAYGVVAVRARTAGACAGPQRMIRVTGSIGAPGPTLARVLRRTRFMLYRASDGNSWFGERTCSYAAPVACQSAQPIAGPLAAAPAGLHVAIDSSSGMRVVRISASVASIVRATAVALKP